METINNNEEDFMLWELQVTLGEPIKNIVGEDFADGAIAAGEQSDDELEALVVAVKKHHVKVDENAPCGCIDGRNCLHTMDNGETSVRPSVAGGPVTAYVAAELVGWHATTEGSSADRFKKVDDALNIAGLPTGSHIDAAAEACGLANNKTGCGADDKIAQNADNIFAKPVAVATLSAALLGESYNADRMSFTDRASMRDRLADWDPTVVVNTIKERDASAIEVLASDETETHGHNEILVVFNYVEGSSIDRDALVAETGKQVFVVDVWYIDKMARALAEGPDAVEQYEQLKHAMVAYQLGTYASLCKGDQRPLIITEAA